MLAHSWSAQMALRYDSQNADNVDDLILVGAFDVDEHGAGDFPSDREWQGLNDDDWIKSWRGLRSGWSPAARRFSTAGSSGHDDWDGDARDNIRLIARGLFTEVTCAGGGDHCKRGFVTVRRPAALIAVLVWMWTAVAACSVGSRGGESTLPPAFRGRTPAEDLALPQRASERFFERSGFQLVKEVQVTTDLACTGDSFVVNSGRQAGIGLTMRPADSGTSTAENLSRAADVLAEIDREFFGGNGRVVTQHPVVLYASGYWIGGPVPVISAR